MPADPPAPPEVAGQVLYLRYCALCHGRDARGYAADNAPSLVSPTFLESAGDAFLRNSIGRGRPGTAMAGYAADIGGPLDADGIDALVAWLRSHGGRRAGIDARPARGDPAAGEAAYTAHCASCHGSRGQRGAAVHLYNSQLLADADDGYLRHAIVSGRPGTRMIGWGEVLFPGDADAIIAHLRSAALPPTPARAWRPEGAVAENEQQLLPVTPTPTTPVVLNPDGKAPTFTLGEGRFARVDAVAAALAQGRRLIILDARAPSDYQLIHIDGAIVTPYYDKRALDVVPNDGTWVVAYCACPHHLSGEVVDELRRRGYPHTAVLDEGIFVWNARGHPVVKAKDAPEFPVPPPYYPYAPPGTLPARDPTPP